jgi:hypothetical protein
VTDLRAALRHAGRAQPKPLKRVKVKKRIQRKARPRRERRTTVGALKRQLWKLFAVYIKARDGNVCFTCDARDLEGGNWHAGHGIRQGGHAAVQYDPKNVHSQCGRCNIWLAGNTSEYMARLIERYGYDEWLRLIKRARTTKSWTAPEVRGLIAALERGPAEFECAYYESYL